MISNLSQHSFFSFVFVHFFLSGWIDPSLITIFVLVKLSLACCDLTCYPLSCTYHLLPLSDWSTVTISIINTPLTLTNHKIHLEPTSTQIFRQILYSYSFLALTTPTRSWYFTLESLVWKFLHLTKIPQTLSIFLAISQSIKLKWKCK